MVIESSRVQQHSTLWELQFGAQPLTGGGVAFHVWAPRAESLSVKIIGDNPINVPMERDAEDEFHVVVPDVGAGADYFYVIDGEKERPDPVSRWQPQGVHGPSRVVDPESFDWSDQEWKGLPLKDFFIYELHTGTFTPEGTFEAIIPKLSYLKEVGVTAIELMPVAEFPGGRNWGYDGTHLYAPQSTYGGPSGLKKLVDACHREGVAVIMDVVYNHLGPEGNYLGEYMPFSSAVYRTPWGEAINFDGPDSDGVRRHFINNALYWLTEYHMDGLRLDAIHRIFDFSPRHILEEIADEFRQQAGRLNRAAYTIAESDLNDVRVIKPAAEGGWGLDAQWSDDFHHSLHALLTGTRRGYFEDFGRMEDLSQAITEGFVYNGRRSVFRRRRHGNSSAARPGEQFVICIQNHDQIANSYWGDRLAALVSFEQQKMAAALLLCAPNLPMLFMGQEFGETAPFFYFTSHTDPALAEAVRKGRREEYASYVKDEAEEDSVAALSGGYSDPQSPATFEQSKLTWSCLDQSPHQEILRFYRDLIALRKQHPCLSNCHKELTKVRFGENQKWIMVERGDPSGSSALLLCNFSAADQNIPVSVSGDGWRLALRSADPQYGNNENIIPVPSELNGEGTAQQSVPLAGWSAVLYTRSEKQWEQQ